MLEYFLLVVSLIHATVRDREALVTENLLLRHQLAVLTRSTRKRPRLRRRDKLFWLVVRALGIDWRRHLVLVRPEAVIRWRRQAWRLLWRWRSRGPIGRPRLSAEVRELVATMARDNPRWGSERIRGELLKLGLVVSKRSIQRYRRRGPAHPSSQSWRMFLANHALSEGKTSVVLRRRARICGATHSAPAGSGSRRLLVAASLPVCAIRACGGVAPGCSRPRILRAPIQDAVR